MRYLLLILFFIIVKNSHGQNLVPNGSFEDTVHCPTVSGQIGNAKYWYNVENTPDYFSACANFNSPILGVPNNILTSRLAAEGYAYCALATFISTSFGGPYNEKIGIKLTDSLMIGKQYKISFKLSSVSSHSQLCNGANNKIGILFSTFKYDLIHLPPTNNFAHFTYDSIVKDTVGWELVSGTFKSDSNYKYISIGVFYDNAHIDTVRYWYNGNSSGMQNFYLIDDIYIGYDSIQEINNFKLETAQINLFPNPADETITIDSWKEASNYNIQLFDNFGIEVYHACNVNLKNKLVIDVSKYRNGIYFLKLTMKNKSIIRPINIIH